MVENLNVTHYNNGDPIPEVKNNAEWLKYGKEGKGCWCYYNNEFHSAEKNGKLYNWYAINDARGLNPKGYHIPKWEEFELLLNYLNAWNDSTLLIEKWKATLNGVREQEGEFLYINDSVNFWSLTNLNSRRSWCLGIGWGLKEISDDLGKAFGASIRVIKDD